MKKVALILISLIGIAGTASASNDFSYTATAAPGSTPDGVDQNSNPVNVWSVTIVPSSTGGGAGAYYGTAFAGEALSGWQIWSSPFGTGTGNGGSIDATTAFAGGALTIGQTVSINFEMRATDPGKEVGVSLLNGSGDAITFYIPGAGPGYYFYTDAALTAADAGPMSYQYQVPFNIAFTVTGANTYSAVVGTVAVNGAVDSWSGTFSGSLIGMDVFNHGAGDASDVAFNNLTVVPEPSAWATLAVSSVAMLGWRRVFRHPSP